MYQTVPGRLFNHQFGSYLETCPYRIKVVAVIVIVLFDRDIIDGWMDGLFTMTTMSIQLPI